MLKWSKQFAVRGNSKKILSIWQVVLVKEQTLRIAVSLEENVWDRILKMIYHLLTLTKIYIDLNIKLKYNAKEKVTQKHLNEIYISKKNQYTQRSTRSLSELKRKREWQFYNHFWFSLQTFNFENAMLAVWLLIWTRNVNLHYFALL